MQDPEVPRAKKGGRRRFVPTARDHAIAKVIKEKREAKPLTQAELAKAVGISVRSLIRYEAAERPIAEQHLAKIEDVVGPCRPIEESVTVPTGSSDVSGSGASVSPSAAGAVQHGSTPVISHYGVTLGEAFDEAFPEPKTKRLALEKLFSRIRELQENPHELAAEPRGSTRGQRKSN